ncbi:hypothetical protein [Bacteroides acidifaciens]|uniref:hypothetical protein n=1 Tax=Bacteroides acidifaciens TaxID=85831 RepID=UPI003014F65C
MKYYIPTSSLNLDNILQAECISPESFYAQRLSGYRHFEQLDELRPFRQIILFSSPISFTINDPDRYNYPVLIEFEGTNQDQDFISAEEGFYLCNHTIQITPSNCRIFFFSESAYNLTIVNTKSNKTIKYFEKYLVYPSFPFRNVHELKILTNIPSIELSINEETFIDKAKGALYAWMLGLKSSVKQELATKINLAQSLYNILTSLMKNPDSFSRFKSNLDSLIEQFKSVDEIEKINEQIYEVNFKKELGPRFGFLKSCFIHVLKKWDCWDYVNAKLCDKWNCSFLPDTKDLISSQDFLALRTEIENRTKKSLASYQSKIDFTDLSKVSISSFSVTISTAPLVSIALKCIIDNRWTCEYLMANRIEAYKVLMSNVVAYLKNNMGEESWDNSRERTYINELYAFLYDSSKNFNLNFPNKELEAISAFLVRGNSYSDIISYLKINEIEDYTLPLVLWGTLSGYMDMNRDYLEGILSESVYNKVYRMLFGVECSVLSAEIDTKISSVDSVTVVNEISPKETFDDSGYMFLLQILKFKNPENFVKKLLALNTKEQLNIKQSLDLILATKEYKRANVQCINAKGAYELIENKENREFLDKKMLDLKLSQKAQIQILEYFGYEVVKKTTKNKKTKSEGLSQNLFSHQTEQLNDLNRPKNISDENSENNSATILSKGIISMYRTWIPVCSSFISDNASKKRFSEDLEWFINNHYEYYYNKKKERKNGVYYGKDLSNDKVIERLKIYLERKLQVNPSWPQIADAYRKVPISKIIDYLTKNYGKR